MISFLSEQKGSFLESHETFSIKIQFERWPETGMESHSREHSLQTCFMVKMVQFYSVYHWIGNLKILPDLYLFAKVFNSVKLSKIQLSKINQNQFMVQLPLFNTHFHRLRRDYKTEKFIIARHSLDSKLYDTFCLWN